jgi:hypothetical protein
MPLLPMLPESSTETMMLGAGSREVPGGVWARLSWPAIEATGPLAKAAVAQAIQEILRDIGYFLSDAQEVWFCG